MKYALVSFLMIISFSGLAAYEHGSFNLGGYANYSFYKYSSEEEGISTLVLSPELEYFFAKNISSDISISITSRDAEDTYTTAVFGIGGKVYHKNYYGGISFLTGNDYVSHYQVNSNYLDFKLGYLNRLLKHVYLDTGIDYKMGIWNYSGDYQGKNEEKQFGMNLGLKLVFPD